MQKIHNNHDSPKDRGHQSDGIIPYKTRLSRDFNIIRDLWAKKALAGYQISKTYPGLPGMHLQMV